MGKFFKKHKETAREWTKAYEMLEGAQLEYEKKINKNVVVATGEEDEDRDCY